MYVRITTPSVLISALRTDSPAGFNESALLSQRYCWLIYIYKPLICRVTDKDSCVRCVKASKYFNKLEGEREKKNQFLLFLLDTNIFNLVTSYLF